MTAGAFGVQSPSVTKTVGEEDETTNFSLTLFGLSIQAYSSDGGTLAPAIRAIVGRPLVVTLDIHNNAVVKSVVFNHAGQMTGPYQIEIVPVRAGVLRIEAHVTGGNNRLENPYEADVFADVAVSHADITMVGGHVGVTLHRTASDPTLDQALWVAIRNRTYAISYDRYKRYLDRVLRGVEDSGVPEAVVQRRRDGGLHLYGVGAYQILKFATEAFLLAECGVRIGGREHDRFDPGQDLERLGEPFTREQMEARLREYLGHPPQLPYIRRVVDAAFPDLDRENVGDRLLTGRISEPLLLELIHTYWLEEGMLMQTMNAISYRFQNARTGSDRDALANMEIDPLRPLNNLLWGYVQDEINRLSVRRRAFEYSHQYGLTLFGKATAGIRPADNRSKFLEGFHNLLFQSSKFFKEDFQTTVIADGFPLLNSLKEVHLILAQGAANEFGSLPWTARVETLLAQFLLARPEMREFLQSRIMVPYKEPWMPQVDTMKMMQGWTDVTVTHFRDLAVYGEQLLLSVRYGDWINVNDEDAAKNWARYWRPEIQGYLHAYRAATGVELTSTDNVDATIPAVHLQRRLAMQQRVRQ